MILVNKNTIKIKPEILQTTIANGDSTDVRTVKKKQLKQTTLKFGQVDNIQSKSSNEVIQESMPSIRILTGKIL